MRCSTFRKPMKWRRMVDLRPCAGQSLATTGPWKIFSSGHCAFPIIVSYRYSGARNHTTEVEPYKVEISGILLMRFWANKVRSFSLRQPNLLKKGSMTIYMYRVPATVYVDLVNKTCPHAAGFMGCESLWFVRPISKICATALWPDGDFMTRRAKTIGPVAVISR